MRQTPTTTKAPLPKLRDKDNLDSELSPDDFDQADAAPSETDEDLLALMSERYQAASNARRFREHEWFLSLAFYLGEQSLGWSTNRGRLIDTRDLNQDWRSWTTRNLIKGKVLTLLGQATQTAPTAITAPLTDSDIDQQAAGEARALLAHLDRLHSRAGQTTEALLWALTSSTACLKVWWDADAEADVPLLGANGEVTGSTRAAVGEICEDVVPVFDLYLDPKARKWDRLAWIIHEQVRDLSYVQQRYGKAGYQVKGDAGTGNAGYIESRMASVVGDAQRTQAPGGGQSCTVRECWEFPSARYPKGRLFTTAGEVVLRDPEPWPTKTCPFIPLSYLNGLGSIYGLNAVWDCIGAQRTYNAAIRAMEENLACPWGKWFTPRGAQIDPDSLNDPREVVYFTPGFKPEYDPPPPVAAVIGSAIEISDANLNDLSGVRAVSEGDAPPGVTAASAIAQLTASDATQLKHCLVNIEMFSRRRAEIEIELASRFYSEPRLIGVQDVAQQGPAGSPPPALTEYAAFKALTAGGSCRVNVVPGSAIPQSPQARQQQMSELFKMLLGGGPPSPDMLAIFIVMLKAMSVEGGDNVTQELTNLLQKMQADQAAAAQAAKEQQAQQQQAAQQAQQSQQAAQQAQQHGELLKQILDQQHAVGMQQNDLGGQLAKMAATHALGQHDRAQGMAQGMAQAAPLPGMEPATPGPATPEPALGDAL